MSTNLLGSGLRSLKTKLGVRRTYTMRKHNDGNQI